MKKLNLLIIILFISVFLIHPILSYDSELPITEVKELNVQTKVGEVLELDFSNYNSNDVIYNAPFDKKGHYSTNEVENISSSVYLIYDKNITQINLDIQVADREKFFSEDENSLPLIKITEGEKVRINIDAFHPDDKFVDVIFFDPLNEKGVWNTEIGDKGEYKLKFALNDGRHLNYHYIDLIVNENKDYILNSAMFKKEAHNKDQFNLEDIVLNNIEDLGRVEEVYCYPDSCSVEVDKNNNFFELTVSNGYYKKPVYFNFTIKPESDFLYDLNDTYSLKEGERIEIPISKVDDRFKLNTDKVFFNGTHLIIDTDVGMVNRRFFDKILYLVNDDYVPFRDEKVRFEVGNQYESFMKEFNLRIYDNKPLPTFKTDDVTYNVTDYFVLDHLITELDHSDVSIKGLDCPFKIGSYIDFMNDGVYECEFILSDNLYKNKDNLTVRINGINRPAEFRWLDEYYEMSEDDEIVLNFNAHDPDNRPISYNIDYQNDSCINYEVDSNRNRLIISTNYCNDLTKGYFEKDLTFYANDTIDLTKKEVTLRVIHKNRVPELVNKSNQVKVLRDEIIDFNAEFYDPDGDEINYHWIVEGQKVDHNFSNITLKFIKPSSKSVKLVASDGKDKTITEWNVKVLDWHYRD
ncbi:MAG: hypothetical protein ACOCRX_08180 [Candidatus Woesearchaeota archaeon]